MAVLLANPYLLHEEIRDHLYYSRTGIHDYSKKHSVVHFDCIDEDTVSELLSEIDENSRNINGLLQDKFTLVTNIDNKLYLKSKSRVNLSETQIALYKMFNELYDKNNAKISGEISDLQEIELQSASKLFFKSDSSLSALFKKLKTIADKQLTIIDGLKELIETATFTLAVL